MELAFSEGRNGCQRESTTPEFSGRSGDDYHLPVAASELLDLSQIGCKLPLSSNEKQSKGCQSCQKAPCSCNGELCRSDECPTLPSKMMILDFLIRSLRQPRRTHNISDLDDLLSEEKLFLDSVHAFVEARAIPKSQSFLLPGANSRKIRSRSRSRTQILKLISTEAFDTSSPGESLLKRRATELATHEKKFQSCSSMTSMSSSQSASLHPSLAAGLLHCIWKDGLPHFEFSADDPVGVYTASPIKVQSEGNKTLDYIYLFHSGEQGRKDWTTSSCSASKFTGKMKVSSSLVLNSDKYIMETQFVLSGSSEDYLRQMQNPAIVTRSKGLARRVAEMMSPAHYSSSPKQARRSVKSLSQQFDSMTEAVSGELSSGADDSPTSYELAAVVVRDYRHGRRKENVAGGWGLKFLAKAGATGPDSTADTGVQNRREATRDVNVVVPKGYHGSPVDRDGSPSSLIERWKSGGRCDCGGWDLGCPIRVLHSSNNSLPQATSQDCKSVDLLLEGTENAEPLMRLVDLTADLHIIYFDSSLSPLQCFSTGIAIIHSQTSDLYPEL